MISLSYKYALRPTLQQRRELAQVMAIHRKLYNLALERRIKAWQNEQRTISPSEEWRWWSEIRKQDADFSRISADIGQHTLARLQQSYKRFFADIKRGVKCGKPKFKSAKDFNSFVGRRSDMKLLFKGERVYLRVNGVSTPIKVVYHRALPEGAEVKQIRVVREPDRWYCVVVLELDAELPQTSEGRAVGIDVGVENLLTLSDGTVIENPRWFLRTERRIANLQRIIEKKKKGSKRRKRAVWRLQKLHRKLKRQRQTFFHRLCAWLTIRYDVLVVEDLNAKGLQQGVLSKHVSDAAWGYFFAILRWHAAKRGKQVIAVSPNGTSQHCARCGAHTPKTLGDRWHSCSHCGFEAHRDLNAALNILKRGLGENIAASSAS